MDVPTFLLLLVAAFSCKVAAWGDVGHIVTCMIAESFFKAPTQNAVTDLLSATGLNFSQSCTWADHVKRSYAYRWSAPLHFADTPDNVCGYDDERDCHFLGFKNVCCTAAVYNYTSQLENQRLLAYNRTEALMFLSHYLGDIHEPMHMGFLGDLGGNRVRVSWCGTKILFTRLYQGRRGCRGRKFGCPLRYAEEGVKIACGWGYKDVSQNFTLADEYFETRWPIVKFLLARGGVRLGGILNEVFNEGAVRNYE